MSSLDRTRNEYDRSAHSYDLRWADYLRRSMERLLPQVDVRPGGRLLDVGCGTGVLLHHVGRRRPGAQLCGIDPSSEMLHRAQQRLPRSCWLAQAEVTALPFADGSFATVTSTSSLRYWPDAGGGLREIARVLEPGGRLILADWCGNSLRHRILGRWLTLTGHVGGHLYRRSEVRRLLRDAGFSARVDCFAAGWYWRFLFVRATLL